jgi:hypothetical protein
MNFGVKLFKVLNGIGLFMTGGLILIFLNAMLTSGYIVLGIGPFFLIGVFIHAILANSLLKNLQNPASPLKESTPGGLQALTLFPILVGVMVVGFAAQLNNPEIREFTIKSLVEQAAAQKQVITTNMVDAALSFVQFLFTTYGIILVSNAILSMIHMKQWKDRQNADRNDGQDDIGL